MDFYEESEPTMNSWTIGREVKERMLEFCQPGTNRPQEDEEEFRTKILHSIRCGRVAILAAPMLGKSQKEVYDALMANLAKFAAQQANGYDARQAELYVDAHRTAYDSLADQLGLR
jgi:hypothetical protein